MKRYLVIATALVLGFLMCSASGTSLAQEEEEIEYSWGRISSVSSNQIVVTEYDYDSDEEVDVTYIVDLKTKFRGVVSLKEIKIGDSVSIDYIDTGGKKVAKVVDVERSTEEE